MVDNYRPITLSHIISKVFEHCLLSLFSSYISSDALQFGFKPGLECSNAIFTLRTVCDYFNNIEEAQYILIRWMPLKLSTGLFVQNSLHY